MNINVLELLEAAASSHPDKIALQDENSQVTYRELVTFARKAAGSILRALETGQEEIYGRAAGNSRTGEASASPRPVAVCIDRNIESIILFMAVVYSGNFYVPLDVHMPLERINMILDDLQPVLIVSSAGQQIEGREIIDVQHLVTAEIPEEELQSIRSRSIDTDPLYAIFTSGSTGRPKGVLITHRGVIDLVEQFALSFPLSEDTVLGNQAPFDFDVSVKDIYNCFYQAATLVVIPKRNFSMPAKLIAFLNEYKINTLIWAVSAMRIVENFKTFSEVRPQYLRLVMFSGEIMPVRVYRYWKEALPDAVFVNLYGPTEITCNCTYYIIDREFADSEPLPIGRSFRNTRILLLDTNSGTAVEEPGKQGEICVKGTGLALGYYHAPEKTKEAFVQNPLNATYPERIYKTGDLGYYNERGELMFTSRKDYQIKHMGHRIELGEIEVLINAIAYVDAAVCVFDEKREKIVLFYQCSPKVVEDFGSNKALERDMVKELDKKLPKFMWPNVYRYYEALPMNKNGKIDRVALKATLEQEKK